MTTSQDKSSGSADNNQDKLERIKKEEKEDAGSYYAQGHHEDHDKDLKAEYGKPLPSVDAGKEEFNMVRALAYLAFGGAALALIFILFFVRDLGKRVDTMGKEVGDIDSKLDPFKKEVNGNMAKLTGDLEGLKNKVAQYERLTAAIELKRAMVTIQEIAADASPEVKSKSAQVVVSIQSMLDEFAPAMKETAKPAEAPVAAPAAPAPTAAPEAAPPAPAPSAEAPAAPPAAPAAPAPAVGEVQLKKEEPKAAGAKALKKAADDDDDDDDDDD
ncbi:MAG: hypothetical protein HZA02_01440 [Nitrospinae bacterium]|nr:hypothetical protein [Nitrospinota bacterium]